MKHTLVTLEALADRYIASAELGLDVLPIILSDEFPDAEYQCPTLTGMSWHTYLNARLKEVSPCPS